MQGLMSALRFMTVLPLGKSGTFYPDRMAAYFPVVGLVVGLLLVGFDRIVSGLWPKPVAVLLDVIFLIFVTGAFHLDGLGDAADGLLGHRSKERALEIMKDSRVGAMGLIAIFCGLSMKWGGIMSLEEDRQIFLIIVPAYARGAQIFGIRFLQYGRPGGGTGHALFGSTLKPAAFLGLLVPFALCCSLGVRGLLLTAAFLVVTFGLIAYYKRRLGCITGDMLGAMTEITEPVIFLVASMGAMQ